MYCFLASSSTRMEFAARCGVFADLHRRMVESKAKMRALLRTANKRKRGKAAPPKDARRRYLRCRICASERKVRSGNESPGWGSRSHTPERRKSMTAIPPLAMTCWGGHATEVDWHSRLVRLHVRVAPVSIHAGARFRTSEQSQDFSSSILRSFPPFCFPTWVSPIGARRG